MAKCIPLYRVYGKERLTYCSIAVVVKMCTPYETGCASLQFATYALACAGLTCCACVLLHFLQFGGSHNRPRRPPEDVDRHPAVAHEQLRPQLTDSSVSFRPLYPLSLYSPSPSSSSSSISGLEFGQVNSWRASSVSRGVVFSRFAGSMFPDARMIFLASPVNQIIGTRDLNKPLGNHTNLTLAKRARYRPPVSH